MLFSKSLIDRWSKNQKLLLTFGVLLAIAAFCMGLVMRTLEPQNGLYWMPDFDDYYSGGYHILHGLHLYDAKAGPLNLLFNYQPFAALLFVPFALLNMRISEIIWTIFNVLALFAVLWMTFDMMHFSSGRHRLLLTTIATIGCTLLDSVLSNLIFGQICVILMLLVFIDVQPWMPRRWCGIATGIAATIKLTPLIFIVYLFLIGRRRGAIQAAAVFIATFLVGLLLLPAETNRYWFSLGFLDLSRIVTATDVQHSLFGFFARLTGNAITPSLWAIPVCAAVAIYGLIFAIISTKKGHNLLGILTVGFTAALVSPVSWSYDYVWIAPALIWLVLATWRSRITLPRILFPIIILWSIVPFYWSGNRVGQTPAYQVTLQGNLIATIGSPMTMIFLAFATLPIWLPKLLPPDQTLLSNSKTNINDLNVIAR